MEEKQTVELGQREDQLQREQLQQEKELRKEWENQEFQDKHALAREIVVRTLRELNGY